MGWIDKKLFEVKKFVSDNISKASETVANLDLKDAASSLVEKTSVAIEKAKEVSINAYSVTKENVIDAKNTAVDTISSFDYSQLGESEFYSRNFNDYKDLSTTKVMELYRSTFEVDKTTMEMVNDVRGRLPVPAHTVEDIFDQCRREATRRAISAFALGGILRDLDNHSAAKYNNLSDTYSSFVENSENKYGMEQSKVFVGMNNERDDASVRATFLKNGYNTSHPLDPASADIEHVISKHELYVDPLIRVGTTNEQYYDLINSPENLVFADSSLNRSMKNTDILEYLDRKGSEVEGKPGFFTVDIKQKDGSVKTVEINRDDMVDAYTQANEKRNQHQLAALTEVGCTVALTGVSMGAQQIVGLIILETIDIFVDEIKSLAINGKVINNDGWIKNSKDMTARIHERLAERFEERNIWERAKAAGFEAGVAGALSVIPQMLISLIIKVPSFILGLIRECTLSVIRCVRVMVSADQNKLDSIRVLLAGAASAVIGLYVGRVVSTTIQGVPLLNKFNSAITDIISGVVVTAVPLAAIYTFEQNKNKIAFFSKAFNSEKSPQNG